MEIKKSHSNILKIRMYVDKFSDQFKTHILVQERFSATGTCDEIMWNTL
jgi:hypothetical protein